jgi:tetratricopeptide (TPR) repeat protein
MAILRTAGHVSLGLFAVLATRLFEMLLPASLRRGEHVAAWWRVAVRFVLFQGVALLCCADPVWNAFRWFSPLTLQVLLAFLAAFALTAHFKTGRRAPLFASFALVGLLSADTPMGIVLLACAIVALVVRRHLRKAGIVVKDEVTPFDEALIAWRITLAFAGGAFAGVAIEIHAFASCDGLAAFGWSWGDYLLGIPLAYIKALLASCTRVGVVLFVAVAVVPVAVEFLLIRLATDDEKHLTYFHGTMFLVFGFVALSQLSGAKSFWFWNLGGGCVRDGILKCAAMCLCAQTAVWTLAVFTMELYLRNFRRIETLRFPDAAEAEGSAEALASAQRLHRIVRTCLLAEPILVFACVLPFRAQRLERAMLDVVADAARETADECRDVEWLFTDGGLDAAVELAAAVREDACHPLRALSMMGGAEDPREIYLRTRGVTNAEDRALLESGAPDALRTWVRTRPDKAKTYAVQIGFELWRRDGRPMPQCSGLVARPEGLSSEEAARGAAAARALARRVLAIYEWGDPGNSVDRSLRDGFLFVQWRLAVLARHRANAYDERGERDLAMEETLLADELDRKNGALDNIRATMAWASKRKLERMTAREGLSIGIRRADFALARPFALSVLDVSPDDPSANFAIGMDFFVQGQYMRAQAYLERCLKSRPNDPAVLNNIAQCRLRRGDPAGALPYAERAREILPDSPEIKRTFDRIKATLGEKL